MTDITGHRATPTEVGAELRWAKVTGSEAIKIIDRDWIRYFRILCLSVAVIVSWQITSWQESRFNTAAKSSSTNATVSAESSPSASPTIRSILLPTIRPPSSVDSVPQPNVTATPLDKSQQSASDGAQSQTSPHEYVVQTGDTLGGIAASESVPLDALMKLNGIDDPDQITVGQLLQIPNSSRRSAESADPSTYTVSQGDNLAGIAKRFGVSLEELARANGIQNPDAITIGLVLQLP